MIRGFMYKSLLIEQFKKYSPKEIREFGEYIRSPYFNKNQSVIKLYDYIRKLYPDFVEEKLTKKNVFSKIFPNLKYNDGFMRTVMFNLSRLSDEFLSFRRFKSDYFAGKKYLLYELNDRNLNRQIEKNMHEISKEFDKIAVHDADYYNFKFSIEYEYFYYLNKQNLDKIEKFINRTDVENVFNHLTYFYLLHAMKHYLYYLNTKDIYKINFKTKLFEDIINRVKLESYDDIPVLNLYYNVLMLHLKEEDTEYFYRVKDRVQKLEKCINSYELADTYINLENYCKKKMRKGNDSFLYELFEIINLEIDKELYKIQGHMSAKFYRCAVDTALKLKKFEWASEFTEKFKCRLPEDTSEITYIYCLALLEFASGSFNKSLELLSKVKYDEVYQKTELRCLTAQLYYELEMTDTLIAHIDSFRHFLCNDRFLPDERKQYFFNFIKYLKNLVCVREKDEKQGLDFLRKQINDEELLYNKDWLLNKALKLETIKN